MGAAKRIAKWVLAGMLAGVLAVALAGCSSQGGSASSSQSNATTQSTASTSKTVLVPDLSWKSPEEARKILADLGLKAEEGAAVYSTSVNSGLVRKQEPESGIEVNRGATVTYYLSKGTDPGTDTTSTQMNGRDTDFAAKCKELIANYGKPQLISANQNETYAVGLSYVEFVDLNNDKKPELVAAYVTEQNNYPSGYGIEVWSYDSSTGLHCDFSEQSLSLHGTSGAYPYVEIYDRPDGGYALMMASCDGSSPIKFSYKLYGYDSSGSFGLLASRSRENSESASGSWLYYRGIYETAIDESTYNGIFSAYVSNAKAPFMHTHLYTMQGATVCTDIDAGSVPVYIGYAESAISRVKNNLAKLCVSV